MQTNTHNIKMLTLIGIIFISSGLSAITNFFPASVTVVITAVCAGLLAVEHKLEGNSDPVVPPTTPTV